MADPSKKEEDLEIVRRAIIQSQSRPIDQQITNAEVKKKIEKDQVDEVGKKLADQFEQGYRALIEEITAHAVDGFYSREDGIKPIAIKEFQISEDEMKGIKQGLLVDSYSPVHAFSVDVQLLFYERAVHFYDQALYEKAIHAFIYLTMINPAVQSFWIGLALGYEKSLDYNRAIGCLEAAIECEPGDFNPFYGLLRCSQAINDYVKIKELLEIAKGNEAMKEDANDLIEYLSSRHQLSD